MVRRETDVGLAARDRQLWETLAGVRLRGVGRLFMQATQATEYVERLALWQDAREPGGPTGGGQANSITLDQSTTATPTTGFAEVRLSSDSSGSVMVHGILETAPGLATTSVSASQSGS